MSHFPALLRPKEPMAWVSSSCSVHGIRLAVAKASCVWSKNASRLQKARLHDVWVNN